MKQIKPIYASIIISIKEFDVLRTYTRTTKPLLQLIFNAIEAVKQKRSVVKRIKVTVEKKNLDKIIRCIADRANERDTSEAIQYHLDNMFGRFAQQYNQLKSSKN